MFPSWHAKLCNRRSVHRLFSRYTILTLLSLFVAGSAWAMEMVAYTPQSFAELQKAGRAVALHFHADWCPTCRAQAKVFDTLKSESDLPITLMRVVYDDERQLRKKLGVRTQSTLIVYRGSKETGRIAGETDIDLLRNELQTALSTTK